MATKTLKKKVQAKPAAGKLTTPVVDSVRDILLAGLGAFAVARQEGGKLLDQGNRLFDDLVREGARVEKKTRNIPVETLEDIRDGVESTVDTLRKQAADQLDRLDNVFSFSVADTLNRLGIPTTGDLDEVSIRMQKMSSQVNESWKGLNKAIDRRVKAALGRLDTPKSEDLERLADRLQRFSKETVENLVMMENAFEKRVTGVLTSMEIPTAEDLRKISSGLRDESDQLSNRWNRLEKELEIRIAGILEEMGIPTRDEMEKLSDSVAELTSQIAALGSPQAPTAGAPTAEKKASGRKAATT
jgi:poly(hydroxyalkanoate) granule-associated protein